jgi:S-adenosylmethionine:tRNA ribosyltransferase-isomerase
MKTQDFDFSLPPELIAQTPLEDRERSRLLVLNRAEQSIQHHRFSDVIDFLKAGDVLVLNNTKVYPARLYGVKEKTGARLEVLILKIEDEFVECLVKNARAVQVGTRIRFDEHLSFVCTEIKDQGIRVFAIEADGALMDLLVRLGEMPLPPYIKTKLTQPDRYQTVYAQHMGSAAAPTAGLHFTPKLLAQLEAKGVELVHITLHVGMGTFKPVEVDSPSDHIMHAESYWVSEASAQQLNRAKTEGRRIVAVGTTSVRTLETQMARHGRFMPESSSTQLFITPGYPFKAIDALITNFHLPKSTLVMLVSAFATREFTLTAYQAAIEARYRFFSFGDAMLIL